MHVFQIIRNCSPMFWIEKETNNMSESKREKERQKLNGYRYLELSFELLGSRAIQKRIRISANFVLLFSLSFRKH